MSPPKLCVLCLRKFTDALNKRSIAESGLCVECEREVERWDDEGGYVDGDGYSK